MALGLLRSISYPVLAPLLPCLFCLMTLPVVYPLIGITTSFTDGEQRLALPYVRAVEAAGGLPWIVPMVEGDGPVTTLAERLDALIVTGGPAVTKGLIGTLPADINETAPERRTADRALLRRVLAAGKPILGICYGMQLLNALAGGTIYADVEQQHDGAATHSQKRGATTHPLRCVPGTHLARLLGERVDAINTRHLQALASVAAPYRVSAVAPDGVVEGIEHPDGHILGVQFHPERMGPALQPLFTHLISQARTHRTPALS